ncbi:MAG: IS630 family transposase [Bryobacterales bacterium]|nr:IS630 family transposase [Bryobacterales bacterium]
MDEKSQIQARDRTQPGLPIRKGRCGTMTHDYRRNGTTTLFAALEVLQGKVIGQCHQRHRHQEFLKFLRTLDQEFPGVPLHVVMDNYGTHKHEKVRNWLKRHPRFVPHIDPASSSWLNLVERWFGHLDQKAIRRGVFRSVEDLKASIEVFLRAWNNDPKPFVWTAPVESIIEKLPHCRRTLEKIQPGCTSPRSGKRKKQLSIYFVDTTLANSSHCRRTLISACPGSTSTRPGSVQQAYCFLSQPNSIFQPPDLLIRGYRSKAVQQNARQLDFVRRCIHASTSDDGDSFGPD